jgi:hypothetical protein
MRNVILRWIAGFILIFLTEINSWAQPEDPGGDPDQPVPISGIEILLGAGALLGMKRLINLRKPKT